MCSRSLTLSAPLVVVLCSVLQSICYAQEFPVLRGDYLGQDTPDTIPEVFAPGIVSLEGRYEYGLAVSPDGNDIFFSAGKPGNGLMITCRIDDIWIEPKPAGLRDTASKDIEAFYTVDGKMLYFSSDMTGDFNTRIWYAVRDSAGWGRAELLESPVNDTDVMWATFTKEQTMYFTNVVEDNICRSRLVDGKYGEVEAVDLPFGGHPFVAPDESYLLFNGKGDIYISFCRGDNDWTEPHRLGDQVNTDYLETCPSLSPDGEYLFFSRYDDLDNKSNIYWVRFRLPDVPDTGEPTD